MRRILFINQFAVTPDQSSGTRHFLIAKELSREDYVPTIVASNVNLHTGKPMFASSNGVCVREVDGVRFLALDSKFIGRRPIARFMSLIEFAGKLMTRSIRRIIGDYDVVYASSPHLFAAAAGLLLSRLGGRRPFIVEIRDLWPKTLIELGRLSRFHPLVLAFRLIERQLYRRADHIVTLLSGSIEHICENGGSERKISVIPNFVDAALHSGSPKLERSTGGFIVMYAGAHGVANSLDTVLDAAALCSRDDELRQVRFHLIGDGPERERLLQRVDHENLHNVVMQGAVPKGEIAGVMAEADAFIMPLRASPVFRHGISPNKLFDYMAAARPILFAVDTETNLVADCGAGVTIRPEDPAALAEGIRKILRLSTRDRNEMGQRARGYALTFHTPQSAAVRVREAIDLAMAKVAKGC